MSAGAPTSAREARALPFILARPQRWRVATAGVVLVIGSGNSVAQTAKTEF